MKNYLSYRDLKYVCTTHIIRLADGSVFPNPSNRFDIKSTVCINDKITQDEILKYFENKLKRHGSIELIISMEKEYENGKIKTDFLDECFFDKQITYADLNKFCSCHSILEEFVIYICEKLLKLNDKDLYKLYASNELIDLLHCDKFKELFTRGRREDHNSPCAFIRMRPCPLNKRPEHILNNKIKEFASIKSKVDQLLGYNEEEILNELLNSKEFMEKYPLWPEQLADRELYVEDGLQYLINKLKQIRKPKIITKANELIKLSNEELIKLENELNHLMQEQICLDICDDASIIPNNVKLLQELITNI